MRYCNGSSVLDDWRRIRTLVFAGGGNRCWWQAGVLHHLQSLSWTLPPLLVGTSAGAGVATSCLTIGPKAAMEACLRLYAENRRMFAWRELWRGKLRFAQQHIYPAWVASFLDTEAFEAVKRSSVRMRVGFTRPARALGLAGSVAMGSLLYALDRSVWHSIHPRLPRWLGLRQEFIDLHTSTSSEDARELLLAAAAAPPFIHARRVRGRPAIDGGFTDSAPIPPQSAAEKANTLVLLTRHYPRRPPLFSWRGRRSWQLSAPVPVSTWDCTVRTTVRGAFTLGEADAQALVRSACNAAAEWD